MRLYLVRHTKVDVEQGTCYGQTDVGLATTFTEEANAIVAKLNTVEFSACFTSPLYRCASLSKVLKSELNLTNFIHDNRLIELNFGEWEGRQWTDIEKTDQAKTWFTDWVNFPTPNGESYLQLANRVQEFIVYLQKSNFKDNVLIVTHGGVIRAISALIKSIELNKAFDLQVEYGQILELNYGSDQD